MALVATVLALAGHPSLPAASVVAPSEGCRTHRCEQRVCRTHRCQQRVGRKRTLHVWWRTTLPYRAWLRSTRMCESGGRYSTNTGNGFYGAYQFTLSSWAAVGGYGYPHLAAPLEQDYRAVRLLHVQGRGAWPVCG